MLVLLGIPFLTAYLILSMRYANGIALTLRYVHLNLLKQHYIQLHVLEIRSMYMSFITYFEVLHLQQFPKCNFHFKQRHSEGKGSPENKDLEHTKYK